MIRAVVSILAVCAFALASGCGGGGVSKAERDERGSALYRQAIAAEQSGDVKEAIRLLNNVLIDEPRSFSAHFQLATLLHDYEEDYVGAIYHYKQYLYLRPESEKSTLAQERIRIAEQLLAPQILKKVGDSVQGISQSHLLKENARLNGIITRLEGEKSVLLEGQSSAELELARLKGDNERLREILQKMRVADGEEKPETLTQRIESVLKPDSAPAPDSKTDAKTLRALRDEASALSESGSKSPRQSLVPLPTTDEVLKKVQSKLDGAETATAAPESKAAAKPEAATSEKPAKSDKMDFSSFSLFGRGGKKEKAAKSPDEMRTYVVQPGDTLFRVAEKYYGDSTQWKRIREANRTRIDPDGRIRAGQIIVIP